MKKTIFNIITVCSVLCLGLLSLVSCKQPYTEEKEIFAPLEVTDSYRYTDSCLNGALNVDWDVDVWLTPDDNGIRVEIDLTDEYGAGLNFFNYDPSDAWKDVSVKFQSSGLIHYASDFERNQGFLNFIYPFTNLKCAETFEIYVNSTLVLTLTCTAKGGCGSYVKPSQIDDMVVFGYGYYDTDRVIVRTSMISPNSISCLADMNGSNYTVDSMWLQVYPYDWSALEQCNIMDTDYYWYYEPAVGGFVCVDKVESNPIKIDLITSRIDIDQVFARYAVKMHPKTSVPEVDSVEYEIALIEGECSVY